MTKLLLPILIGISLMLGLTASAQDNHPEYVYVTPSGTVWHSTPSCSYLSRSKTVNKVKYGQVSHLKPCSRCGHAVSQTGTTTNGSQAQQSVNATQSQQQTSGETYNGHKVYTGPRGGKYYINSSGNKVYISR